MSEWASGGEKIETNSLALPILSWILTATTTKKSSSREMMRMRMMLETQQTKVENRERGRRAKIFTFTVFCPVWSFRGWKSHFRAIQWAALSFGHNHSAPPLSAALLLLLCAKPLQKWTPAIFNTWHCGREYCNKNINNNNKDPSSLSNRVQQHVIIIHLTNWALFCEPSSSYVFSSSSVPG